MKKKLTFIFLGMCLIITALVMQDLRDDIVPDLQKPTFAERDDIVPTFHTPLFVERDDIVPDSPEKSIV